MRLNETLLRCCLPPSPVFPDGLYILTFAIPLNVLLFPLPPHFKQNLPTNTGNSLTKLGCMFLFHQLEASGSRRRQLTFPVKVLVFPGP